MTSVTSQNSGKRHAWVIWLLGIVAAFIIVASLILLLRLGQVFLVYGELATWINTELGIDETYANLLAILITAVSISLLGFFTSFFLRGTLRKEALIITVCVVVAIIGLLYFKGTDVYFAQQSGRTIKYYADTPDGIIVSRQGGFDPKYRVQRQVVTPAIAARIEREKRGIKPNRIYLHSFNKFEDITFFGMHGEPQYFYYVRKGTIELFDNPGFHPQAREQLKPITPDVVFRLEELFEGEKKAATINENRKQQEAHRQQSEAEIQQRAKQSETLQNQIHLKSDAQRNAEAAAEGQNRRQQELDAKAQRQYAQTDAQQEYNIAQSRAQMLFQQEQNAALRAFQQAQIESQKILQSDQAAIRSKYQMLQGLDLGPLQSIPQGMQQQEQAQAQAQARYQQAISESRSSYEKNAAEAQHKLRQNKAEALAVYQRKEERILNR